MGRVVTALVLFSLLLAVPAAAAAGSLVITQPSANETRLAEMRDFYVYGIFTGTVSNPGDVRIEVYSGDTVSGTPVRTIQSHVDPVSGITNDTVIESSYPNGTRKNGAMVPDLIKLPGGILDPTNKVMVTPRYYLGLIQGGVTRDFDTSYKDSTGTTLTDLTAGNYTLEVTGLSGTCAGEKVNRTITLGLTNAILGTFRPTSNKNALTQYGITHDRRSYFDWFPGYFTDPDNSSVWYQADQRWTPNNGIEVVNNLPGTLLDTTPVANNTLFIYNINSGSATCGIELASILRYHLEDDRNTTFLYYDIGEPTLTYNDAVTGGVRTRAGSPLAFPAESRIRLTRAEIMDPSGTSYENLYDPNDATTPKTLDFDPADGVSFVSGKEFILYGAVKPIGSSVTATATPYRFTIDNRISTIDCTITDSKGNVVATGSHNVNLARLYNSPGDTTRFNSLWEYGIEVAGLTTPGSYTVSLTGKDVSGTVVTGTATSFTVTVNPLPVQVSNNGDTAVSASAAPQVVISPGAPAGQPVTFDFSPASSSGTTAVESVTLVPTRTTGQVECILKSATPGTPLQLSGRDVAGYHSIAVNWINPDAIGHADIAFSVDKAWLDEHRVAPDQIVMLRYTGSQWVELPTRLEQTFDTAYGYRATTPGFSWFAITRKADSTVTSPVNATAAIPGGLTGTIPADAPSAPAVTSVVVSRATTTVPAILSPAVTPPPTLVQVFFPPQGIPIGTIVAWAVVIVLILIAAWLIRRWWIRRQNPALFRRYD